MWEKVPAAEDVELKLFLFLITGSQEAFQFIYLVITTLFSGLSMKRVMNVFTMSHNLVQSIYTT